MLEGPGPSDPSPARQRPRVVRLGAGGAPPLAGDPPVLAVRRRAGLHPQRGAAVQRRHRELQRCVGSAAMGQTGSLVKLEDGNKDCEWIYRIRANPGRPWGGIVPPAPVLAPGAALGSRPRVALSSAQAPSM